MKCPICGCTEDRVLDTRPVDEDRSIRRRRECTKCHYRFTSYETIENAQLYVIKRDNTKEEYDRNKVMEGLRSACKKRPISLRQMENIVDNLEIELRDRPRGEIDTRIIGERIMNVLREMDEVAYIRFASVYNKFSDIDSFMNELILLKQYKAEQLAKEQAEKEGSSRKEKQKK